MKTDLLVVDSLAGAPIRSQPLKLDRVNLPALPHAEIRERLATWEKKYRAAKSPPSASPAAGTATAW